MKLVAQSQMIVCKLEHSLQAVCHSIPDDAAAIGHLDSDTALSRWTFQAALAAAGACCHAVDCIMSGSVSLFKPPLELSPVPEICHVEC